MQRLVAADQHGLCLGRPSRSPQSPARARHSGGPQRCRAPRRLRARAPRRAGHRSRELRASALVSRLPRCHDRGRPQGGVLPAAGRDPHRGADPPVGRWPLRDRPDADGPGPHRAPAGADPRPAGAGLRLRAGSSGRPGGRALGRTGARGAAAGRCRVDVLDARRARAPHRRRVSASWSTRARAGRHCRAGSALGCDGHAGDGARVLSSRSGPGPRAASRPSPRCRGPAGCRASRSARGRHGRAPRRPRCRRRRGSAAPSP